MKGKWNRLGKEVKALLILVATLSIVAVAWASFRGDLARHASLFFDYANPSTLTVDGNLQVNGSFAADSFTSGGEDMTVGLLTVNTGIVPDADGGAYLGASGNGIGNTFIDGDLTASTGTTTLGAVIVNTSLVPDADGGFTLGASGNGVGNTFIDGTLTASTNTATFGAVVVNTSIVPDADGGATLGASGNGIGDAYFDGDVQITTGELTADVAAINILGNLQMDAGSMGLAGTSYTLKGIYLTQLTLSSTSNTISSLGGTWDASDIVLFSPSMCLSGSTARMIVMQNETTAIDFYTSPSGIPGAPVVMNILMIDK